MGSERIHAALLEQVAPRLVPFPARGDGQLRPVARLRGVALLEQFDDLRHFIPDRSGVLSLEDIRDQGRSVAGEASYLKYTIAAYDGPLRKRLPSGYRGVKASAIRTFMLLTICSLVSNKSLYHRTKSTCLLPRRLQS